MSHCAYCGNARGSKDCIEACTDRQERLKSKSSPKSTPEYEHELSTEIQKAESKYKRKINKDLDKEPNWLRAEISGNAIINLLNKKKNTMSNLKSLKESIQSLKESLDLVAVEKLNNLAQMFIKQYIGDLEDALGKTIFSFYEENYDDYEGVEFSTKTEQSLIQSAAETIIAGNQYNDFISQHNISFDEESKEEDKFVELLYKNAEHELEKSFDSIKEQQIDDFNDSESYKKDPYAYYGVKRSDFY